MTQEVAPDDKNSNREENDQVNKFLAEALNGKSEGFKIRHQGNYWQKVSLMLTNYIIRLVMI